MVLLIIFATAMYSTLRNILFKFDPEAVHYFSMNRLRNALNTPVLGASLRRSFAAEARPVNCFGLTFPNAVGLAAGFDKNALYLPELAALGFGHVEVGTVTPLPQAGNDKPRLIRLPKDKALINRMGFNNDGMEVIAKRLAAYRKKFPGEKMIIGGNIGKNKITANEDAADDYEKCFIALQDHVDYFVVNVSSPNTPGLRELQEKDALRKIFEKLYTHNAKRQQQLPILLKIAPDLSKEQVDDVISLATEINLAGLVISNTTLHRSSLSTESKSIADNFGAGGLSGQPVKQKSTELLRYVHAQTQGKIPLIGSGGIFTAEDAREKIAAGASLLQVWTGFVYEGPHMVKWLIEGM